MRKQELIHLHGLLVEIRGFLDERDEIPADAFETYETKGVAPTAIHRSKGTHHEAVVLLMQDLGTAVPEQPAGPEALSPPPTQPDPPTQ